MSPRHENGVLEIRPAQPEDATSIAVLATQLGYPSSTEEVKRRLALIPRGGDHAVLVAVLDGYVMGWLHVFVCHLVESDTRAEIGGLVVNENHRGRGIGRKLMTLAEEWARAKDCNQVSLRSNIIRGDAHRFYEKLGYARIKTQHAFCKILQ
jgi:GNAT superfamily N-acetyltransferase